MTEKTFKLSLKDRIALLNILPREGNIVTLRIIRDLQGTLSFSEAEISDYAIAVTQIGISNSFRTTWNAQGNKAVKNVKIGANAESVIIEKLKELSDKKLLPLEMLELYERFVEKKEVAELKKKDGKNE